MAAVSMNRDGIGQGPGRARDGDHAVLDRLAQHLQDLAAELGEFVQEKHAVVGQGYFARPRQAPAARQSRHARRMVRRAERTPS